MTEYIKLTNIFIFEVRLLPISVFWVDLVWFFKQLDTLLYKYWVKPVIEGQTQLEKRHHYFLSFYSSYRIIDAFFLLFSPRFFGHYRFILRNLIWISILMEFAWYLLQKVNTWNFVSLPKYLPQKFPIKPPDDPLMQLLPLIIKISRPLSEIYSLPAIPL